LETPVLTTNETVSAQVGRVQISDRTFLRAVLIVQGLWLGVIGIGLAFAAFALFRYLKS